MAREPNRPSSESRVRWDLVRSIRRQIDEGTYDTPERLDLALERLFDALGEADPPPPEGPGDSSHESST